MLHGRMSKRVYHGIVDRVKARLSGWAGCFFIIFGGSYHFDQFSLDVSARIHDAISEGSTGSP